MSDPRDLGALRSVHRERSGALLWVVAVLLGGPIFASALFWGIATSVVVLMALVTVAGVVALLVIGRRHRGELIELHESGLVVRTRDSARSVAFSDVLRVTSSSRRRRAGGVLVERHVVEPREGAPVVFTLFHDRAPDLLAAIHAGTRERLRTEVLRKYDAGEVIEFGPLSVSEDGFRDGGGPVVPWTQIERATIDMPVFAVGETWSQVKVWRRSATAPLASYASDRVPNAAVLVEVVALAVDAANED